MADREMSPRPVALGERLHAMDVLRGVALLGILPVNVMTAFALPTSAMFMPTVSGGFEGANFAAWLVMHTGFEQKMMAIFSMLFGAGAMVFMRVDRSPLAEPRSAVLYYRRVGWLLLFGLVHAYAFWYGDILFTYALLGMLLYPMRRLSGRVLVIIGGVLLSIGLCVQVGLGGLMYLSKIASATDYAQVVAELTQDVDDIARESQARTTSYAALAAWNAREAVFIQIGLLFMYSIWRVLGLMLIGAGLLKLGVFNVDAPARRYVIAAGGAYAIGVPLSLFAAFDGVRHNFDIARLFLVGNSAHYVASLFIAAGHVGAVLLVCRIGALRAFRAAMSAVGRMAFSNYIAQTLVCLFTFCGLSGFGFGMFNRWDRATLLVFVASVWCVQIAVSMLWLRRFEFGPLEWWWRSLTYWRPQPIMRSLTDPPAGPAA